MNNTDKLKVLVGKGKGSVSIQVNDHKDCYETVEQAIGESLGDPHTMFGETDQLLIEEMIKRDEMVKIQFYPHTPVGFYVVCHYDLDLALDQCLEILNEPAT